MSKLAGLLTLTVLICSCASKLPVKPAQNLKIEYSYGGGMANQGEGMVLTRHKCTYGRHYGKIKNTINFNLSGSQLENLYQVFRANKFDRIKVDEGITIHDKAGATIYLGMGRESYGLGTSGTRIADGWQEEWRNVLDSLQKVRDQAIAKNSISLQTNIEPSLTGWHLSVYAHDKQIFHGLVKKDQKLETSLMKGTYNITTRLRKDGSYSDYREENKNTTSQNFYYDTRKGTTLSLSRVEQKLFFTLR